MGSLYRRRRTTKDGQVKQGETWWLKYYANGRAIRESSGTTLERKARRMLRVREGDAERGIPIDPKVNRISFADAMASVLTDCEINGRKTYADAKRRIDLHLDPFFGVVDSRRSRPT